MLKKTLAKLEYRKIVDKLMDCCTFQVGRDRAELLEPYLELSDAARGQRETSEAKEVQRLNPLLPLGGLRDIRSSLRKVEIGGMLFPTELLEIHSTLSGGRRLKKFLADLPPKYPLLQGLGEEIGVFKELEDKIVRCIGEDGEVSDQASSELAAARRQIRNLQLKIKERLESIIRSSDYQKYLQDPIITMRNDRYVVPVKQEYRSQMPGIVHDQSASGATLFIEPLAVVEMDNELRRLAIKEKQEIERILLDLSKSVQAALDGIEYSLEMLGQIDLIFAKGKLSSLMDAGEPKINAFGRVDIIKGRHPLIQGNPVPVSIHVGKDFDTLVITGPNTGGKTVTLKTIGLFCLMAAAGLHVPADVGTELSVFEQIFADIGDEQSIEQSLSTFSSHMTNIVGILQLVNHSSLVLLDEVGAGTDPSEGAALAMAILTHLQNKGAKTIATTHYSELKTFAYDNPRVENASVEFDVATLRPTYKLLIGMPGRSNAFEIAARLGLDQDVVSLARGFLSEREVQVADLLQNLEETQRATEGDREEAAQLRRELEALKAQLEAEKLKLQNKERELLAKASQEAAQIVKQARAEAEGIISELKVIASEEKTKLHVLNQSRERLKRLQADSEQREAENKPIYQGAAPKKLKPGSQVDIPKFKQKGYILTPPNAQGEVLVQVGIMKVTLRVEELRIATEEAKEVYYSGSGSIGKNKIDAIGKELDLRGLTVDEAMYEVDKYLDDAVLSGLSQVCIIHGKGTGALRKAIREHLEGHPHVRSFRLGQFGEGGAGVSVVELK